jgi:ribonuclease P protein component
MRLLKRGDYERVYANGKKKAGRLLRICYLPNEHKQSRFGISVGKKFGNAVTRNRLKRWIRESVRRNKESIDRSLDIIIYSYPRMENVIYNSKAVEVELQKLLLSIRIRTEIGIHKESNPYQP